MIISTFHREPTEKVIFPHLTHVYLVSPLQDNSYLYSELIKNYRKTHLDWKQGRREKIKQQ